jgi:hypothetical protein
MERASTLEALKQLEPLTPPVGEILPWAAVEEVVNMARQERRFRTIYRAWIRHLRKWHNRKMVVVPGKGLRILPENERATDVCSTLGRTWTLFQHAKTDVDDIQIVELKDPEVEEVHFVRHIAHRLHRSMAEERQRLTSRPQMPAPTPLLPQRTSPAA